MRNKEELKKEATKALERGILKSKELISFKNNYLQFKSANFEREKNFNLKCILEVLENFKVSAIERLELKPRYDISFINSRFNGKVYTDFFLYLDLRVYLVKNSDYQDNVTCIFTLEISND